MVHRSDPVEKVAVVAKLTTPPFWQDIELLVESRIARMVEERLTSAAVLCADEGAERCVAAFLLMTGETIALLITTVLIEGISCTL